MLRNSTIPSFTAPRAGLTTLSALTTVVALAALLTGCGDPVQQALDSDGYHVADLTVGSGPAAEPGDFLTIVYSTCLVLEGEKGREIDHSEEGGRGFLLGAGEVMPGWDEGLVGMQVGGVRRLLVASAMIGPSFQPRGVADDDLLWCEVELLDIATISVTDLEVGAGEPLQEGDYAMIHYTGWHYVDGARVDEFVTSGDDDAPTGIMLGAGLVNRGLEMGLLGMQVGGKRQVIVPPALAYGHEGRDNVKPDATLIYEVDLVAQLAVEQEILIEGEGEGVAAGQRLRIQLQGWVHEPDGEKGEQFQDSRRMNQPLDIILGDFKVQPGLELGLRGMKVGETRRLIVPSELAFGSRGWHRGDRTLVAPDTDVIYEVQLLSASRRLR